MTTTTPLEIDTELARIAGEKATVLRRFHQGQDMVKRSTEGSYNHTHGQTMVDEARARHAALNAEAAPLEAEYAARRWNRYFLVNNTGGHVHRGWTARPASRPPSTAGSSSWPTATRPRWWPSSARSPAPSASPRPPRSPASATGPARWPGTPRPSGPIGTPPRPSGTPRRRRSGLDRVVYASHGNGGRGDRIETIAAAKTWIKTSIDNRIRYGYKTWENPDTHESIDALVDALVARGVDAPALVAKWTAAAEKAAA